MLPILTFDENKLRPSYGYFFDRSWLAPDESIVAIAWKFAKMNVLPGHVVAQQLSVRPTDPYEGFAPILSNIDVHALARTFAIPRRALCVSIESPGISRRMSDRLRYCSRCMGLSYHGVMHQHVGATRCPCHRTPLEEACRGCGFVSEYRLNARLLDTPFGCPRCRRLYGLGYGATRTPRPLPSELRQAITRSRYGT